MPSRVEPGSAWVHQWVGVHMGVGAWGCGCMRGCVHARVCTCLACLPACMLGLRIVFVVWARTLEDVMTAFDGDHVGLRLRIEVECRQCWLAIVHQHAAPDMWYGHGVETFPEMCRIPLECPRRDAHRDGSEKDQHVYAPCD